MSLKKKTIILFIQLIGILFFTNSKVFATAPTITSVKHMDTDLYYVTANANGSTITSFLVGTSLDKTMTFSANMSDDKKIAASYLTMPNGTYYVWAKNSSNEYSAAYTVYVTASCSNTTASNRTDSGYYESCFVRFRNGTEQSAGTGSATCAPGYNMSAVSTIRLNDCGNKSVSSTGLEFRYCKKQYAYSCKKAESASTNTNSKLSSLSLSSATLSPNFSASTYTYSASTTASSITINASLANSSASFVSGNGPRTVNLNIGKNTFYIKTQAGGYTSTYTINITRSDTRSSTNTLSSLSTNVGNLSPNFKANTINYSVSVGSDITSADISATLSDSKSSFVKNYGPRTIKLGNGTTKGTIKVKSESGSVRTYTISFKKPSSSNGGSSNGGSSNGGNTNPNPEPNPEPEPDPNSTKALLESLEISSGTIDFDSNTFDYTLSVDYEVTTLQVKAKAKDDNDKIIVNGGENLEEDTLNEVTIVVTSSDGEVTNTYTIYVTRKNEDIPVSSNSLLKDLSIDDYKIKFDAKVTEYEITIKEGIKELNINATPDDEKSTITIEGNDNLTSGSKIKIRVTAEDGSYTDYFINIRTIKKGGNAFLTVIVIILIVLVMGYLVLRAMGYKLYFNLDAIKSLFNRNKE